MAVTDCVIVLIVFFCVGMVVVVGDLRAFRVESTTPPGAPTQILGRSVRLFGISIVPVTPDHLKPFIMIFFFVQG